MNLCHFATETEFTDVIKTHKILLPINTAVM